VPILVLTSVQDELVDTRCSERLAAAWHCDIARHPSAGHDLPLDDAAWVLGQVERWLEA
jgi:predicted alpha/beta hydrolase family esterase